MKDVAVILLNYNGTADTLACVESLNRSEGGPPRIVVVDNASADRSVETALAPFENVELINSPDNLGFGKGNNLGICRALEYADCAYVFVLNNDTEVRPDTLRVLKGVAEKRPEAAALTCKIVYYDRPDLIWYAGGGVNMKRGRAISYGFRSPAEDPRFNKPAFVEFLSGCAMFFRREVIERHEGFDRRFFMYVEDLELSMRLSKAGDKMLYTPETLLYHKVQGSMQDKGRSESLAAMHPRNPKLDFYAYHVVRNTLYTFHMHLRGAGRTRFHLLYVAFTLYRTARYLAHGRLGACRSMLRGYSDFLRGK